MDCHECISDQDELETPSLKYKKTTQQNKAIRKHESCSFKRTQVNCPNGHWTSSLERQVSENLGLCRFLESMSTVYYVIFLARSGAAPQIKSINIFVAEHKNIHTQRN